MSKRDHIDELLAASPLFSSLPAEVTTLLRAKLTEVSIESGDWLMRKGDSGDALYIVDAGRLEVVLGEQEGVGREDDETMRVLRVLGRGATVGELALVTGDPRSASVRANRDSTLLRLSHDDFQELITTEPTFAAALTAVSSITSRIRVLIPGLPWSSARVLGLTSVAQTVAPSRAKASAVARPMPCPAAVITATLPASLPDNVFSG